jgi:sterol desaturase/sphingolipid hydroxylase (fatty acid hydroxylase superfamily)
LAALFSGFNFGGHAERSQIRPSITTGNKQKGILMLGTIVLVLLILLLVGALPNWSHSASWGYAPSGTLGTVLIVVLIFVLLGKI